MLGLVNNKHCLAAFIMSVKQKGIDKVYKYFNTGGAFPVLNAEFITDRGEQFFDCQLGIEYECYGRIFWDLVQQTAAYRGLSGADFACKQDKTAVAVKAI